MGRVLYRSEPVSGTTKNGDGVLLSGHSYYELIAFPPGEKPTQPVGATAHDLDHIRKFLGGSLEGSFKSPYGLEWKVPAGVFDSLRADERVQVVVTFKVRK
jgi:hypothetical protein